MKTRRDKVEARYQLMRRVLADNLQRALQRHPIYRGEEKALAEATGIGKSTINRIVHGQTNLTLDNLTDLAAALGVRANELLEPFKEFPLPPRPKEFRPEDTTIIQKAPVFEERPVLHSKQVEDAASQRRARRGRPASTRKRG